MPAGMFTFCTKQGCQTIIKPTLELHYDIGMLINVLAEWHIEM